MPHLPTTINPYDWHGFFAIETNNRAWLLAGRRRSQAEDEEMLSNAHASYAAGDMDSHKIAHDHARQAIKAIADPEDRDIVQSTFDQVPVP